VLPVLIDFAYFRARGNKIAVKAGLVYFKEDGIRKGMELLLNFLEPFPILLSVYCMAPNEWYATNRINYYGLGP
jgi:hypothetical protein